MSIYKYYRNVVYFLIVPNIVVFILMLLTKGIWQTVFKDVWIILVFAYFIAFIFQPEKAFKIKN